MTSVNTWVRSYVDPYGSCRDSSRWVPLYHCILAVRNSWSGSFHHDFYLAYMLSVRLWRHLVADKRRCRPIFRWETQGSYTLSTHWMCSHESLTSKKHSKHISNGSAASEAVTGDWSNFKLYLAFFIHSPFDPSFSSNKLETTNYCYCKHIVLLYWSSIIMFITI